MPSSLYMLDTNIVSHVIRGDVSVQARLQSIPMDSVCISAITEAELLRGVAKKPDAKHLPSLVKAFLSRVDVLPWDSTAAASYAVFRTSCEKAGKSLGAMDMLIAAHSIAVNAVLVTNDKAFYNTGDSLTLEDWVN